MLLDAGADPDVLSGTNHSAIHYSFDFPNHWLHKTLIEKSKHIHSLLEIEDDAENQMRVQTEPSDTNALT